VGYGSERTVTLCPGLEAARTTRSIVLVFNLLTIVRLHLSPKHLGTRFELLFHIIVTNMQLIPSPNHVSLQRGQAYMSPGLSSASPLSPLFSRATLPLVPLLLFSKVPQIVWQSSLACTAQKTVSLTECPSAALSAHCLLVSLHPRAHPVDHQALTLPSLSFSSFPPPSPSHCLSQTLEGKSRPNGSTLLKQRHLEGLGYALVTIPYWEWDQIRGKEERLKYLARKLQQREPPPPFLPEQRSSLKGELGEPVRTTEKRVRF
jgi:hypothetical protein